MLFKNNSYEVTNLIIWIYNYEKYLVHRGLDHRKMRSENIGTDQNQNDIKRFFIEKVVHSGLL